MIRHINEYSLSKIKQWEGLRTEAYQDEGGVWTIGYGHTSAAGLPAVSRGMKISEQEATNILIQDLGKFEARVERLVKVPLTDHQFGALVSFDLNTGALDKSTLLKKLNGGDYEAVPKELMKWTKVKSGPLGMKKNSPGLVNRRSAEIGLWSKGSKVASNTVEPASPQPNVMKAALSPEVLGPAAGTATALFGAASTSSPIGYVVAAVIALGAIAAIIYFIRAMRK